MIERMLKRKKKRGSSAKDTRESCERKLRMEQNRKEQKSHRTVENLNFRERAR
jgi:hypothetical protein